MKETYVEIEHSMIDYFRIIENNGEKNFIIHFKENPPTWIFKTNLDYEKLINQMIPEISKHFKLESLNHRTYLTETLLEF